jgi:heme-degrading monooxygenase HmoA
VIVSLVRFRSGLTAAEVTAKFEERADRYRQLPGLVEKIYLRYRETGDYGAIYVWESDEALRTFQTSELAQTIPDAYQVEAAPQAEIADVYLLVRKGGTHPVDPLGAPQAYSTASRG